MYQTFFSEATRSFILGKRQKATTTRYTTWSSLLATTDRVTTQEFASSFFVKISLFRGPRYLKIIVTYVFPIVAGLGIIFNILPIATILNNSIRNTSQGLHLTMLSVANIVCLILSMSEKWALPVWGTHFPPLYLCNFKLFSYFFSACVSSMSRVCVATNCFLEVQFPIKAKIVTTRKRAIIAQVTITLVLFFWCLPLLFTVEENCDPKPGFYTFVTVHYVISSIVGFYGAALYLLAIKCAILFRLAKPTAQFVAMFNVETRKSKTRVIATVALVSLSFVVCHTTMGVITLLHSFHPGVLKDPSRLNVVYTFINLLLLSQHSVNFLFYIAVPVNFRHSLKDLFTGRCLRNETPTESAIPLYHLPRRVCFRRFLAQDRGSTLAQWQ